MMLFVFDELRNIFATYKYYNYDKKTGQFNVFRIYIYFFK